MSATHAVVYVKKVQASEDLIILLFSRTKNVLIA